MDGHFLVGGSVVANFAEDEAKVRDYLSHLLQVPNLAVLVGSGASFDLGGPSIRAVTREGVTELLTAAQEDLEESPKQLLASCFKGGDQKRDLETLVAALTHALGLASTLGESEVHVAGESYTNQELVTLRNAMTAAIANACDLPATVTNARLTPNPLMAHETFLARLVRVRRRDLPRPWIFTTNYDLVLEKALDAQRIPYIDGFSGTVHRTFQPQVYSQDLYQAGHTVGSKSLLRVPDLVYLAKIHGSINWMTSSDQRTLHMSPSIEKNARSVIYPSPLKESETLGYPYADLMRVFAGALASPDAALITVGYGFADDHVNRIISNQFARNPSLQLALIEPFRIGKVSEDGSFRFENTPMAAWASSGDRRISAVCGTGATFTNFALDVMPVPEGWLDVGPTSGSETEAHASHAEVP